MQSEDHVSGSPARPELPSENGNCTVTVRVISWLGECVPQAEISLQDEKGAVLKSGRADESGQAVFSGVVPGHYAVSVSDNPGSRPVLQSLEQDFSPGTHYVVLLSVRAGLRLNIHAAEAEKGEPVAGIEYELLDLSGKEIGTVTTGKDGRASLENLAPGEYRLREKVVPYPLYAPWSEYAICLDQTASWNQELSYFRFAELHVHVFGYDGRKLDGAQLRLRREKDGAILEESCVKENEICFNRLLPGTFQLLEKAPPKGYTGRRELPSFVLSGGESRSCDLYYYTQELDRYAKKVVSNTQILAHLFWGFTSEFRNMSIRDIIRISLAEHIVKTNISFSSSVRGLDTEVQFGVNGTVVYDSLFKAVCPKRFSGAGEDQLILGIVEAMSNVSGLKYTLKQRGFVYVSDAISMQHGMNIGFSNREYQNVKRTYTFIIDTNPPQARQNKVEFLDPLLREWDGPGNQFVSHTEDCLDSLDPRTRGMLPEDDISHLVIIHLGPFRALNGGVPISPRKAGKSREMQMNLVLQILDLILFETSMAKDERIKLLRKCGIRITKSMGEGVNSMWDYQSGLITRAREEVEAEYKPQLEEQGRQIASQGEQLEAKDRQIASQGEQLDAKDQQIASQGEQLEAKDQQIASQDQQLEEQGRMIRGMAQQFTEDQIAAFSGLSVARVKDILKKCGGIAAVL